MRDDLDGMRNELKGSIRIGAMPSMSPVLPTLISRFNKRHPGVRADVQFVGIDDLKQRLSRFSLDVGMTYVDQEDLGHLNTLPIFWETLQLLVPDDETFAGRDSITWQEVADLPLAMLRPSMRERQFVDGVFAKSGVTPEPRVESESILHLMFQVQFAGLVTIVPGHFATMPGLPAGTRMLNLVEPSVSQQVAIVWAQGDPPIPMSGAFVNLMTKLLRDGELARILGDLTIVERPPKRACQLDAL
jgi:DNA-binding transcriptional LysR family regulator